MVWNVAIVTGASRGFGRAVSLALARSAKLPTLFVLSGRNEAALSATAQSIKSVCTVQCEVETHVVDFSRLDDLEAAADAMFTFKSLPSEQLVGKVYFVCNHGSLHPVGPIDTTKLVDISSNLNLNVASFCFLNADIVRRFKEKSLSSNDLELVLVNVSSLGALQPFSTMAVYSAGKAARDMYLRTLAEELKEDTQLLQEGSNRVVRILNYAPGPMDTDMGKEIVSSPEIGGLKEFFINGLKNNSLVDIDESASKLVRILETNTYENAQHIDFYDVV